MGLNPPKCRSGYAIGFHLVQNKGSGGATEVKCAQVYDTCPAL